MTDLWIGLAVMWLLSIATYLCAVRVARRVSMLVVILSALLAATAVFVQAFLLQENVLVARFLPVTYLIILGNVVPLATAWLAGLAWARTPGAACRKCIAVVPVLLAGAYTSVRPVLGQPPHCVERWRDEVCIQTSDASCSPSAAATLLRYYGIEASEQEMARLCLTRERGTPKYGLYRGLKRKTDGTLWRVAVLSNGLATLRAGETGPVLISAKLVDGSTADPHYTDLWEPGIAHAVVLFRVLADGKVDVGDPSLGRQQWTIDDLRVLWNGRGYYLVKR